MDTYTWYREEVAVDEEKLKVFFTQRGMQGFVDYLEAMHESPLGELLQNFRGNLQYQDGKTIQVVGSVLLFLEYLVKDFDLYSDDDMQFLDVTFGSMAKTIRSPSRPYSDPVQDGPEVDDEFYERLFNQVVRSLPTVH